MSAETAAQVMVRLPVELHDEVKRIAAELDLSMAQAIRAAVRQWVQAPSLAEVRPASDRGACRCQTPGVPPFALSCPKHAEEMARA